MTQGQRAKTWLLLQQRTTRVLSRLTTTHEFQIHSAPQEPSRDLDYRRLVIAKETQILEVQKLQLQLELAKLQVSSGSVVSGESNPIAARTSDQTKSLRDLCAPQRTIFPQLCARWAQALQRADYRGIHRWLPRHCRKMSRGPSEIHVFTSIGGPYELRVQLPVVSGSRVSL